MNNFILKLFYKQKLTLSNADSVIKLLKISRTLCFFDEFISVINARCNDMHTHSFLIILVMSIMLVLLNTR